MNTITYTLHNLNLISITFRFFLCIICGGILGIDRERKMHAAGLRTYVLVCLGSTCAIMVSQYIFIVLGQNVDTTRMASQVISGIGFLGAGTIIVTGTRKVTGLTTAAGLWASACMGLAIGIGFYECALLMCVTIYFSLKMLNGFESRFISHSEIVGVFIEHNNSFRISSLFKLMDECHWAIYSLSPLEKDKDWGGSIKMIVSRSKNGEALEKISEKLYTIEGVLFVKKSDF